MHTTDVNTEIPKIQSRGMEPLSLSILMHGLTVHYDGRFSEDEITHPAIRYNLNKACRVLDGIQSIGRILYAHEIERHSQGGNTNTLDEVTAYGLYEALMLLVSEGNAAATNVGDEIFQAAKKGGQ